MTYQEWLATHGVTPSDDYDTISAYRDGVTPDDRGHLPDTYKKPNHITYSDESVYAQQKDAPTPGMWRQDPSGKWGFWASTTNIKNAGGVQKLLDYFNKNEPDATLILPNYKVLK